MISVYHSAKEYLEASQQMLEERELENNLILGLCNALAEKNSAEENYDFVNAFESGRIMATSINTIGRAIVSCSSEDTRSVKELADYYLKQNIGLKGVFGEIIPATVFARFYGSGFATDMTMIVHRLSRVNDLPVVSGLFRAAENEDVELIVDWTTRFKKEEDPVYQMSRDEMLNMVRSGIASGNFFLWTDKNVAVSMAAINRRTSHVGVVGYVYSPEEFRKKGYATAVVQRLSEHILQSGFTYCGLFTDQANPTSNHIYRKIGYEQVATFANIRFFP
ncbi:MAG TPA: GNAT family N-acetyltransferase [Puia sp.]|nr:GNAT family N-acetyltransferase [Puia sp.]